jgi:hypothetical protein
MTQWGSCTVLTHAQNRTSEATKQKRLLQKMKKKATHSSLLVLPSVLYLSCDLSAFSYTWACSTPISLGGLQHHLQTPLPACSFLACQLHRYPQTVKNNNNKNTIMK